MTIKTPQILCFTFLLAGSCRGGSPATPPAAQGTSTASQPVSQPASQPVSQPASARGDFLSLSGAGEPRWAELRLHQDSSAYQTVILAKASPEGGGTIREVRLTLLRLHGPGEYPLGFGWSRGASRATVELGGTNCVTPREGGGVVEILAGPANGRLAPGERLEGRFRVRCFPDGDDSGEPTEFTGEFAVTASEGQP